jgi:FkbM family methyltransferase
MLRRFVSDAVSLYSTKVPEVRGKNFLIRSLGRLVGPVVLPTPAGPSLPILLSSSMDLAYLRPSGPDEGGTIRRAISSLAKGDIFIDVGANVGYYTVLASKQVGADGRVFAIEPSKREFNRLVDSLSVNNATGNCVALNVALGRQNHLVSLIVDDNHTGLNRIGTKPNRNSSEVACFRVDDLLVPLLPQHGAIGIKIDVEGYEYDVLLGMRELLRSKRVTFVVVEITGSFLERAGSSAEQLFSFMQAQEYRPTVHGTDWQYDEVFVRSDF